MKKSTSIYHRGWIYAYAHFATEVICFYFMYRRFGGAAATTWMVAGLAYDALAFVPQSILGILSDSHPRIRYGVLGGVLLVLGFLIPANVPGLVILCIGNCLVHISGARATTVGEHGLLGPSGIFVGAGSFGVIAGRILGEYVRGYVAESGAGVAAAAGSEAGLAAAADSVAGMAADSVAGVAVAADGVAGAFSADLLSMIPLILMLAATVIMLRLPPEETHVAEGFRLDRPINGGLLVLLAFVTVVARAYVGYAIPSGWNKTTLQTVILFCCMGAGKCLGGVLADRLGARRLAVGGLLLSLPFLTMGDSRMLLSLIGVGLFSMTMPVSLGVLLSRFPDMPGLCFGITTVGLFVGTAPAFFVRPANLNGNILVVCILTIVAVAAFLSCMRPDRKGEDHAV